ncbi:unnamed protein product [Ostreobium quekettii]|uniref:LysM domain-containing protein n=1 Tax=Ostreobium quekettii TaxID=121088 RepID=A0A8S1IW37_9CHLO|nr:unnamed protein product [Ostreobium quekettii]
MGCMCSRPQVLEHWAPKARRCASTQEGADRRPRSFLSHGHSRDLKAQAKTHTKAQSSRVLSVREVLELAQDVVMEGFRGCIDPLTVAAIALLESGGNAKAVRWEESVGEARHGLCMMLFSTARWLMSLGHNDYMAGSAASLQAPKTALYFGAAYLNHLSGLNGQPQSEEFVVQSYHIGPKSADQWEADSSTDDYWRRYVQAKRQLQRLYDAIGNGDGPKGGEEAEEPLMHIVQKGESLKVIAKACGSSVADILCANPELSDAKCLRPGDCIEVPQQALWPRLYAVQSGDSMASIARRHDVSLMRLLKVNPDIKGQAHLQPGWVLSLPGLRGTTCEAEDTLDSRDLTSSDSGLSFLAAMAGKHGMSIEEGHHGDSSGIHCSLDGIGFRRPHEGIARLGARLNALRARGLRA